MGGEMKQSKFSKIKSNRAHQNGVENGFAG